MDNPILTVLDDVSPPLLARISSLAVERGDEGWRLRLSYCLYVEAYPGEEIELDGHQIRMAGEPPDGVSVRAHHRWPDSTHPLPDAAPDEATAWLWGVHDDGRLGALDVARYDGHGPSRWLAKTHAGSDEERVEWLRAIR
jgi:hypothetical protein